MKKELEDNSVPIISKKLWDDVQKYLPDVMKDMIENDKRYTCEELCKMLENSYGNIEKKGC